VRTAVSGSTVIVSGSPESVARAKALVAQLDTPAFDSRYVQVYRIHSIDAASVADLLRRSLRDVDIVVDASINALAVTASAAQHQRIADAVSQLDPAPVAGTSAPSGGTYGALASEVVVLKSAMPPGGGSGGIDAFAAINQALQIIVPDVHMIQLATPGQVALIGSGQSIQTAKDVIEKLDLVAPQVVLDTEILELDESVAKNLGVQLGTAVVSTQYTEISPTADAGGSVPRIGRLQAFGRTPISFTAQLNLAISNGHGRVLADPRITTLSGRTASIRAGDTISILTTTSGNAGTIATTQVQSFQTGVTLDITPLVDSQDGITVTLHPVVNSLIGVSAAGVPEISTRDTQTTVHLRDNETLVIGGLIQENETRTSTKLPVLSDIPLLGRVFRNEAVNHSRNELIIVVTPHVVFGGNTSLPGPPIHEIPKPQPLPTLPPNMNLPPPSGRVAERVGATPTPAPLSSGFASTPNTRNAPTPAPTPSAFAQTNVFTFGAAPQSNFAKPTDPVQIFYATLSPTVVTNGTSVHLAAVTSSNATSLKLQIGSQTIGLSQSGLGQWQATFPFPKGAIPSSQSSVPLSLIAGKSDGTTSTVAIPINVNP